MFCFMAQFLILDPPIEGNMVLPLAYNHALKSNVYFLYLLHTQNQKGKKIENLLVEHHNSL